MPRKLRLSVYKKNQYHKSTEAPTLESLPVSISLSDDVAIFKVSISRDFYLSSNVCSSTQLQNKVKVLYVLPKSEYYLNCSIIITCTCISFSVGWIDVTETSTSEPSCLMYTKVHTG